MNLLLAIQQYTNKLIEYGYYPKSKKPSLGKLEKMADLCYIGKYRKLSRYIPDNATEEQKQELNELLAKIKEICEDEKNNS